MLRDECPGWMICDAGICIAIKLGSKAEPWNQDKFRMPALRYVPKQVRDTQGPFWDFFIFPCEFVFCK